MFHSAVNVRDPTKNEKHARAKFRGGFNKMNEDNNNNDDSKFKSAFTLINACKPV